MPNLDFNSGLVKKLTERLCRKSGTLAAMMRRRCCYLKGKKGNGRIPHPIFFKVNLDDAYMLAMWRAKCIARIYASSKLRAKWIDFSLPTSPTSTTFVRAKRRNFSLPPTTKSCGKGDVLITPPLIKFLLERFKKLYTQNKTFAVQFNSKESTMIMEFKLPERNVKITMIDNVSRNSSTIVLYRVEMSKVPNCGIVFNVMGQSVPLLQFFYTTLVWSPFDYMMMYAGFCATSVTFFVKCRGAKKRKIDQLFLNSQGLNCAFCVKKSKVCSLHTNKRRHDEESLSYILHSRCRLAEP